MPTRRISAPHLLFFPLETAVIDFFGPLGGSTARRKHSVDILPPYRQLPVYTPGNIRIHLSACLRPANAELRGLRQTG